jgi:hypothetical protein
LGYYLQTQLIQGFEGIEVSSIFKSDWQMMICLTQLFFLLMEVSPPKNNITKN